MRLHMIREARNVIPPDEGRVLTKALSVYPFAFENNQESDEMISI